MTRLLSTLLFVAAQVASVAVRAEQALIDEISVTTKRRAVSTADISSAVSVIPGDTIRQQLLTTDALASSIGTFLQQTTPGQGAAVIRGLKGSAVLHLVDGMRLNNAIFRSAPTQYLALVPTNAVERVEVVRGTPTSLYGSDAVGGVVQVVTRTPSFAGGESEVRGDVQVDIDSANLSKSMRGSVDLGTNELAGSISAEHQSTGNRRTGGGERIGPSGFDSRAVRLLLVGTPTNDRSWLVDLHMLEQPETPRVDELVPGFGQSAPASSEFFFAPNQRLFAHARHTRANGSLGLDWTIDGAWQRIVDDRVTRDLNAPVRRRESNRSDLSAVTVTAARERNDISWLVGAEYYYDRVSSARIEEDINTLESQDVTSRFPDGSTMSQAALYGSVDRRIGDKHLLSAGLRFSSIDVDLPATLVSVAASVDADDASGDLGWIYDLTDASQVVANLGFGFRAPNVFDLGTLGSRPGNRFNIPNTALDSEEVVQGDVGFRHRSDRWQFEFMVYALDYDDRITSILTGDVTADGREVVQSVNAARSSIRGAEAGVEFDFTSALSARVVLNYARGEQRIRDASDEPADRIPPLHGRVRIAFDDGGDWQLAGWADFAGRQDRLSARDVRDIRINPAGTAGWATVGARASREFGSNWHLAVTFDNILDKRYRRHGSGIDGSGRNLAISIRRIWQ